MSSDLRDPRNDSDYDSEFESSDNETCFVEPTADMSVNFNGTEVSLEELAISVGNLGEIVKCETRKESLIRDMVASIPKSNMPLRSLLFALHFRFDKDQISKIFTESLNGPERKYKNKTFGFSLSKNEKDVVFLSVKKVKKPLGNLTNIVGDIEKFFFEKKKPQQKPERPKKPKGSKKGKKRSHKGRQNAVTVPPAVP
jgi:hypothetical protein